MVGIELKDKQTLAVFEGKTTRPPGRPADNWTKKTGPLHGDYIHSPILYEIIRWLTPRYPERRCLYTGAQCAVVSVNIIYWWSLSCDHGLDYANQCENNNNNNNINNKNAALEARNLKTAYQVYIVDYYCRSFTAVSSIARAHDMLSRRYLLRYYRLLLCHRLVRHELTRSRKKNGPGIQNPKSSPRFSDVFLNSRT